ncbi:arylsulfatase [Alienimonas sp. DA493]|uniref:arylsulfatase n=1 Tax=Alienimonas sp. DA493 TaxID=3373605 RepID=UPI003754487B
MTSVSRLLAPLAAVVAWPLAVAAASGVPTGPGPADPGPTPPAATAPAPAERPNVLVILADDLGYSDLGCYGGEIPTPHVDALAANGVKCSQIYNSARCCPSRASLMTGLYPTQAGIGDFTTARPDANRGPGYLGRLNDRCATLAEALKPAGYRSYYVGKWHLHPETGPIARGFDEFYGYTSDHSADQYAPDRYARLPEDRTPELTFGDDFYATDAFTEYALEFLKQGQESGDPWFLFLAHSSPHFPVQAPAERADPHEAVYRRGWDVLRAERFARMQQIGLADGPAWALSPRSLVPVDRPDIADGYPGEPNPAWADLPEDRRADLARRMAVFAAMVQSVDAGVGRIVDRLRAAGELDNTLILFLSDNGACYEWGPFGFDGPSRQGINVLRTGAELREIGQPGTHQSYGSGWANLGNTPFRLYKHFTHEGGISTPFIAHWPAGLKPRDGWVREPGHVMDVLPTILDATGTPYPESVAGRSVTPAEGRSLLPVLRGEPGAERTIGFDHQGAHALRRGDWKLVRGKRFPEDPEWELYDLAADRCELHDLAAERPELVAELVAEWEAWARRVEVIWESPEAAASPKIADAPLTIEATVRAAAPAGVVLAQGGRQHGYALHFVDGVPTFDVRVNGRVARLSAATAVAGEVRLEATLTANRMTLRVNDGAPIAGDSPGLLPVQPIDAFSVGHDDQTAAGDYEAPNPFVGEVLNHQVTAGRPAPAERDGRTPPAP